MSTSFIENDPATSTHQAVAGSRPAELRAADGGRQHSAPGGRWRPTVVQVLHSLEIGGAEVLAARLARRLQDKFRFIFACLDGLGTLGAELRSEGFIVEVLGRRP